MDDLIFRNEAIEKAKHDYDYFYYKDSLNEADKVRRDELLNMIFWLGNLPSVDAVTVVRCKNCKFLKRDGLHPWCDKWFNQVDEDDYCSRARKEVTEGK